MISFQVKLKFSPDFINFPTNYMTYLMLSYTDQLMHISMTMNFNIIWDVE